MLTLIGAICVVMETKPIDLLFAKIYLHAMIHIHCPQIQPVHSYNVAVDYQIRVSGPLVRARIACWDVASANRILYSTRLWAKTGKSNLASFYPSLQDAFSRFSRSIEYGASTERSENLSFSIRSSLRKLKPPMQYVLRYAIDMSGSAW